MTATTMPRHPVVHGVRYRDNSRRQDRIEWLIDNGDAYAALIHAIRHSRESIRISQLAFDANCVAHTASAPFQHAEVPGAARELLLDVILEASSTNDVTVQILLNATLLLDTADPLRRAIATSTQDTSRVHVRGISRFPQLLHAKMVIIDDRKAFLVGSPFVNGYWDDACHAPVDERRPARELGGRPLHDVSVAVEGPVVREISALFAELWSASEGDSSAFDGGASTHCEADADAGDKVVSVATTIPSRFRCSRDKGSLGIVAALLNGIERAQNLIYVEHQYLSSRPVVNALSDALERHPELEIVIVLNQNPDVTAYRGWQNARLAESGMLAHPRVGLYTLWSAAPRAGDVRITLNQVFVHSKVMIVDDRWAMVGSANLDGVSLDSYGGDFSWALPRRIFRDVRNVDVALAVGGDSGSEPGSGSAGELRRRLWREHLGESFPPPARGKQTGSLALWRERARENIARVNGPVGHRALTGSFILPYSVKSTPRRQLKDIGISAPVDLRYEPGWLEVHCSPAWVRNMFL